ncbi:MAG: hypothetical protein ACLTDV_01195 [Eubacterium sp.]
MVNQQTTGVDTTVSGATYSSRGILHTIQDNSAAGCFCKIACKSHPSRCPRIVEMQVLAETMAMITMEIPIAETMDLVTDKKSVYYADGTYP